MQKMLSRMLLTIVLLGALLMPQPQAAQAGLLQVDPIGFVVNSAGDGGDNNLGDGICDTGTGYCTLRAALEQAAALSSSRQMINFTFGTKTTIQPTEPLPALSDGDDIFGEGRVILDGMLTPDNTADIGLNVFNYESSVVRGLQIQNFSVAGIYIRGSNKLIGGSDGSARNIIINNGIGIDFATDNVYDNIIRGNYIGVDADGVTARPNGIGIQIHANSSNQIGNITIGGDVASERNIISGNTLYGIKIDALDYNFVYITGNYIGTNAAGTAALPNTRQGIHITNSQATMEIGGYLTGEGNLIAGNGYDGVLVDGCLYITFYGNKMSTNHDGSAYLPNQYTDISVRNSNYVNIGGDTEEKGNTLLNGVELITVTDMVVRNNWIGTAPGGARRAAATSSGVRMVSAFTTQLVGNRISYFEKGINLVTGSNNQFSLNRIYGNASIGIDLGGDGVTPNDSLDGDTGANSLQNYPLVTSAQIREVSILRYLDISVTLNSAPNTTYRIELFSSPSCHAGGTGEGYDALRNSTVTTNASGNASWTVNEILYYPSIEYIGPCITATATSTSVILNTSEFSPGVFFGRKLFLPTVLK